MSIPTIVNPDDVERIANYLRIKPAGVTLDQATSVLKEVLDKRKVAAFLR